ncbi:transglycosylase SLT domain-containing protein [Streptomyces specialis]|uniref:transglycosylase SLT domain-containing protein n=1 Tax=Streptomyces specialis TaxID=498367 RepID=UPI00073ED430|nr:transglycosylase SLT domain-containing protein [Streptomyces specialis]
MPAFRSTPKPRSLRGRGAATAALASAGVAALAPTAVPAAADSGQRPSVRVQNDRAVPFDLAAAGIPGQRPASDGDTRRAAERAERATEAGSVLAGAAERRHADAAARAGDAAEAARLDADQAVARATTVSTEPVVPADPAAPAEPAAPPAPVYTDDLDGWIREALDIMAANGIPGTYDGLHRNILRESSGDPNAINLWDINAMNGTPSIGLLQVIQPTFDAYYVPGTPYDIYDPVANLVAAANYAADRYGSIDNVFGAY